MSQHRSIKQRLQKAKSIIAKKDTIDEWVLSWSSDQSYVIKILEAAIRAKDWDKVCIATGQIKSITEKRFEGLQSVIDHLINRDNLNDRI